MSSSNNLNDGITSYVPTPAPAAKMAAPKPSTSISTTATTATSATATTTTTNPMTGGGIKSSSAITTTASSSNSNVPKGRKSSVSTKPVHPLTLSTFAPTGCELSVWAYLTLPRPSSSNSDATDAKDNSDPVLPNLVTAHANSLKIYVLDPSTGTLVLASTYDNLAGTVITLHALPRAAGRIDTYTARTTNTANTRRRELVYDGLLLGFAGHPRLSIVYPPGSGIQDNWDTHTINHNDTNTNITSGSGGSPWNGVLTASSIIDLTLPLVDRCWGSSTPLEQDLVCAVTSPDDDHTNIPTVTVILGGGVAVAAFHLPRTTLRQSTANTTGNDEAWWRTASEPYLLPLSTLSASLCSFRTPTSSNSTIVQLNIHNSTSTTNTKADPNNSKHNRTTPSTPTTSSTFCHGFGDILATTFLTGFTEPVLVLLHSNPQKHGGTAWSGRLAHRSSSTRCPLSLTAVSVSIGQRRSVVLWSLRDGMPSDSFALYSRSGSSSGTSNSINSTGTTAGSGDTTGGVLIMGANELVYVDCAGRVRCALGVNGWVRSTGSSLLLPRLHGITNTTNTTTGGGLMQPNPSPLTKLAIQLDGSCLAFTSRNVALISLRDGTMFCLELHAMSSSSSSLGRRKAARIGFVPNGTGRDGEMCMSLSPVGFRLGAVGRVSTICALPLVTIPTFKSMKFVDDNFTTRCKTDLSGSSTKKEDYGDDTNDAKDVRGGGVDVVKDLVDEPPTSLGLVFAGSRLGDSTLLLYGLQEGLKLEPLVEKVPKTEDKTEVDKEQSTVKRKKTGEIVVPNDDDTDNTTMDDTNTMSDEMESDRKRLKKEEDSKAETTSILAVEEGKEVMTVSDDEVGFLSEDEILRREEEALYAPISNGNHGDDDNDHNITTPITPIATHGHGNDSNTDSDSDTDNDGSTLLPGISAKLLARPQITQMSVFQHFKALDCFTGLGPIGPGCVGTVASDLSRSTITGTPANTSTSTSEDVEGDDNDTDDDPTIGRSSTNIHPCGYGSSGGLAIMTAPGIGYGASISNEVDCRNIQNVFSFTTLGYVMMTNKAGNGGEDDRTGCILLRLEDESESEDEHKHKYEISAATEERQSQRQLIEVDMDVFTSSANGKSNATEGDNVNYNDDVVKMETVDDEQHKPSLNNVRDVLTRMKIITAKEFYSAASASSTFTAHHQIMVMVRNGNDMALVILSRIEDGGDGFSVTHSHVIGSCDDINFNINCDEDNGLVGGIRRRRRRGELVSVSVAESLDSTRKTRFTSTIYEDCLSLTCVWSTGCGSIFTISRNYNNVDGWFIREILLEGIVGEMAMTTGNGSSSINCEGEGKCEGVIGTKKKVEEDGINHFYSSNKIVAMDIFSIADDIFQRDEVEVGNDDKDENPVMTAPLISSSSLNMNVNEAYRMTCSDEIDIDDLDLYGDEAVDRIKSLRSGETVAVKAEETTTYLDTGTGTGTSAHNDWSGSSMTPSRYNTLAGYISGADLSDTAKEVVAVCRQNGQLQIFDVASLFSYDSGDVNDDIDMDTCISSATELSTVEASTRALLWMAKGGCGSGASILTSSNNIPLSNPNMHNVCAAEIRVFFSGLSNTASGATTAGMDYSMLRSLCLLIETNLGDLHLYTGSKSPTQHYVAFQRVAFGMATRSSKEEIRHRTKLRRRGIVSDVVGSGVDSVRSNRLHRFTSISGQDGLFAAIPRPLWFLSERGAPAVISHRLRHAAPAGVSPLPVNGFCSGLMLKDNANSDGGSGSSNLAFLTLHDRIGRVGSQRLTLYNGLPDVFSPHGMLPGGGLCVQKVPLGVTVRQIKFIDDASVSSVSHPLYALLISKEAECDQSHLNDDGLTTEERRGAKEEKEREKTRRQVEADLGGFEVEQEWVEEIEREDCFEVEKKYGGAPPIPGRVYEIWLVDASGWNVIDTYQLEEWEHGVAIEVMNLSDISGDPNGDNGPQDTDKDDETSLFLSVGTGIVDHDGEDVSSRGRILLFEIKRTTDSSKNVTNSGENSNINKNDKVAAINFVYEKDILLGPVTCLVCLPCENKNRLVVGAGAEITVEQWGDQKLTQVGFFHANMQVQSIVLFKTFLLLSDAYDSLHFLVWRESDKSLTLLAKDYEPTCVYAAGLLTRGGAVSFVCHDDRQNLTFFSYAPDDPAARGGNKLVLRADYHLGAQTVSLQSHHCRSSLLINSATIQSSLVALKLQDPFFGKLDDDRRFALHFGTTDGGFGSILPLNENVYWRLLALQSVMSNALESDCSLSQRAWRLYRRTPRRGGCKSNDRKKGVIDGDLVMKYTDIPLTEQENLASAIGSTVDLVVDNLLEVCCSASY